MSFKIDETVGHNLRAFRLERNLTQQALAERADLSKQTISNLEKGAGANSKTIERIAECLDVSPLSFYKERTSVNTIKLKRVPTASAVKGNDLLYIAEIEKLVDKIVTDTKDIIYFQQVSPVIKDFFKENTDIILKQLDVEQDNKNRHILSAVEENLIIEVKRSVLGGEEELDELLEE